MVVAQFINQYSGLLTGAALLAGLGWLLLRQGRQTPARNVAAFGLVAASLLGVWLLLRTGSGPGLAAAEYEAALGQGQPVLIEYYSDY